LKDEKSKNNKNNPSNKNTKKTPPPPKNSKPQPKKDVINPKQPTKPKTKTPEKPETDGRRELAKLKLEAQQQAEKQSENQPGNQTDTQADNKPEKKPQKKQKAEKMPFKKWVENYIYHNKWWLVITTAIVFIAGYVVFDILSKKEADLTLLIMVPNIGFQNSGDELAEYFKQFTPDLNDDGEVLIAYMYLPVGDETFVTDPMLQVSNSQQLTIQMSSYDNLILIADSRADSYFDPKAIMYEISMDYKIPQVEDYGLMLKQTSLKEKIAYPYEIANDVYLGIRRPDPANQSNFKQQYEILQKVIADLTE
jgi:hypothetical protein